MLINGDVYQSMRQLSDIYGDYCGFWLGKYRETLIQNLKTSQIDHDENPVTITEQYVKKMKEITDENHVLFGSRGHLNLLNVLSDLIIAGSDISDNAFQWSMLYLMLHPEHQWRIVEEAD